MKPGVSNSRSRPLRWPAVAPLGSSALGLWLTLAACRATDLAGSFEQANRCYEQGKYAEAASQYERTLANGEVSAALYFNLGNAHFKCGHLGQAMVNYRRAEQLAPRDPDIRANLGFARNTVPAGITLRRPFWQRRLPRLTLNEWVVAVMVPGWAWFALLALGQARPALRPVLRRYVVLAASATALGGVGLWLGWRLQFQTQTAVVVVKEAVLRHGPLDESPSLQTLRDGQELRVVDSKDGWLQLAGANRGVGWLKQDQVIVLGGP